MNLDNAGNLWSSAEISQLGLEFKAGMPGIAIAEAHGRRIVEITSRLDAMRLIHFKSNAWYNSFTAAVWLPWAEKRARSEAEQVQLRASEQGGATGSW